MNKTYQNENETKIDKKIKMNSSDLSFYKQNYKNIERPFANVDLTKIPWELVMKIMEQQALEARQISEQMPPQVNFEYQQPQCNFNHNGSNSTEESDNSFSDERMSSEESQSDISQNESDIEIDVDSIEEETSDYFIPSIDNIPVTVLHFERNLREKELKKC